MSVIEKSVEVNCPLSRVYNQWTQFESFPRFMEGVEQVFEDHLRRRAEGRIVMQTFHYSLNPRSKAGPNFR